MDPVSTPQILSIQGAQSTNTHRSDEFYKFPMEVRAVIFYYVLCNSWHGKSPNLLKALRGDRCLYFEALPIFYMHNVYDLRRISQFKRVEEVWFLRCVQNLRLNIPLQDPR